MIQLVPVNQSEFDAAFERMEKAIDEMGDVVVHKAMAYAIDTVNEIFEGEGAHPGLGLTEWKELSGKQIGIRAGILGTQFKEHPILQFYGDLYLSLTDPDHYNAEQQIVKLRVGDYTGDYGTRDEKFEMHQTGDKRPQRIIWPERAAEHRLMDMMEGHVIDAAKRVKDA